MEPETTLDYQSTRDELNAVFVGHTVVAVGADQLLLDNGTELQIVPNEGAWGCGCGAYDITELNDCDNVITGCKIVETAPPSDGSFGDRHTYRLFAFSGHRKVNLLTVDGDDGTGMYGAGFVIYVRRKA